MKRNFYAVLFLLADIIFLTAQILPEKSGKPVESREILSGLNHQLIEVLKEREHIYRYDDEMSGPVYVPETEYKSQVADIHKRLSPEVLVEGLYMVPYPDGMKPSEVIDEIYDLSLQVSSISGVKYISELRKKYAVLFTKVYAVNNPDDKVRIDDPVSSLLETEKTVFVHMKENAIGRGYYRMDYARNINQFTLTVTNVSELGFIIPAVAEEDMTIFLQIIPCTDVILIYGYCGVVLQNDELVTLILDPYYAFYSRMTAMEIWLYNSLHGTDLLPSLSEPMQ